MQATSESENGFHIGDVVRYRGGAREMKVASVPLGNQTEGIYNGVLCTWSDADGEHEDVFAQASLELVWRPLTS